MKMFTNLKIYLFVLLGIIASADSVLAQSSYFFYSFSDSPWTLNRRNSNGSSPTIIYTPPYGTVLSSAADASINKLYYFDNATNSTDTQAEIIQSDYDGNNKKVLLTASETKGSSLDISLAAGDGYLFYAYKQAPYTLRRMNSDGTGDTLIYYNPTYGYVGALAVDVANKYLYFYENKYDGTNSRIARTDLDGKNLVTVFKTTAPINCLAAGNGYFFFAPSESPWTFRRRNSDGTNEQVVYTPPVGEVECCSYNEILNKIYFYDNNPKAIYISDIDGSNRVTLYSGFSQKIASLSTPKADTVLPVELTQFTASNEQNKVVLKWKTATELNNYGFDIQRKADTGNWDKIGFVKGSGNSYSPKSYMFVDESPLNGKVEYRLKQIDDNGSFKYSDAINIKVLPIKYELYQNYPNPFNPSTTIKFSLQFKSKVMVNVYNILGEKVAQLVNEIKDAGSYKINWNAAGRFASGVYFYSINAKAKNGGKDFRAVKKMIMIK